MSDTASNQTARKPATIGQQAEFLRYIISRCTMRDGSIAKETLSRLKAEDVEEIKAIAARLERIAPYEREIRRMVTGK